MKIKFVFIAMALFSSELIKAESTYHLNSPRWHYNALIKAYPEFKSHLGGFSYEISLQELSCASSNIITQNQKVSVSVECTAINEDGKVITRSSQELFLGLLNAGIKLDRSSEPGTTYIVLKNLACSLIEPKPSSPKDQIVPQYSCSFSNK